MLIADVEPFRSTEMNHPSTDLLMPIYRPDLPYRRVIVWCWVAVIINPLYFAGSLSHSLLLWFGLEAYSEGKSLWASLYHIADWR